MPNFIEDHIIHSKLPLRQVLLEDFKSIARELPISGGWGYSQEDAIVLHKENSGTPQDYVSLETLIVEKRIYEELIIFRPRGSKFAGIKWDKLNQTLVSSGDRYFDHLEFDVTAHREQDFESLKKEMEESMGKLEYDFQSHIDKHKELLYSYKADYWFDITDFYHK